MTTEPPTSPGTSSSPMPSVTPSSDGATAMRRPSGRRAKSGAPIGEPSPSRTTVAATTVASVGASTPRATSTAEASICDWAAMVSPRWNPPGGGGGPVEAEGVLGDEPTDPGDQAQPGARSRTAACRSARFTKQVAQCGDGVGGVVVSRASEVGEPTGDGQCAGAVPGDAQRLCGQLDRRGEARVDVEDLDVVDAEGRRTPAGRRCSLEECPAGGPDGRRATGVGSGHGEPHVGHLGPGPDEHGPVAHPGPGCRGERAHDQGRGGRPGRVRLV